MKAPAKAIVATLGASTFFLAVSQSPAQNPGSGPVVKHKDYFYAEIAKAPEKARAKPNPLAADPDAVAAGSNLFEQHCAECHGDTADGGRKGPSLRVQEIQGATPGALFWLLTNGVVRRGMPVWSKLPEPQRWQLVAYIRSLGVRPTDANPAPTQHSAR
jgi:mono/diheme cytochrome c family protein